MSATKTPERLWSSHGATCLLIEREEAPRFEVRIVRGDDVVRQDRLYAKASAEMLAETWQTTLHRQSESR